ncbi:WD domain-containing protein [Byssothecium circinans]|uniref:WD domain-containing protein n=1 Tax=Byssothecium circinans TaxID=147558 RepID=A0A6A5TA29_9PLEO|nr:WD domain-containing protein [Byssothecium circinans]
MSAEPQYECTRVPVTASASCGPLYVAAEGPFLRFYRQNDLNHLESKQVFQAQAIHGIAVLSKSPQHVILVVWGGLLVRILQFDVTEENHARILRKSWIISDVVKAPDWILDLSPEPQDGLTTRTRRLAAVTAHNALLEVRASDIYGTPVITIAELTSSSRSILYSAHILWESTGRVLVAAGTAFGEIMYWSWSRTPQKGPQSQVHRVFLGHEGSIFGVQISQQINMVAEKPAQRLLASCSDDRTIRIWDVSDVSFAERDGALEEGSEGERTQHTGFTNASFDTTSSSSTCLAIGWGHISRVWSVQFIYSSRSPAKILLMSSGEDATLRTWHLTLANNTLPSGQSKSPGMLPYKLSQVDYAAYNSGKNLWTSSIHGFPSGSQQVIMGGADSKLTACFLGPDLPVLGRSVIASSEYTVISLTSSTQAEVDDGSIDNSKSLHKSSKLSEFFRSYAFVDESSYLLTTNSGSVYHGSITLNGVTRAMKTATRVSLIAQPQDLNGYSICAGLPSLGVVFVAGSRGSIYIYQGGLRQLRKIHDTSGKVGNMFAVEHHIKDPAAGSSMNSLGSTSIKRIALLATVTGRNFAQLLYVATKDGKPDVSKSVPVPIAELGSNPTITSMEYISSPSQEYYLFLGFRQGSIAMYRAISGGLEETDAAAVSLIKIFERVHCKETVSAMCWLPNANSSSGHLISTGRDGRLAVNAMDLTEGTITTVHDLILPIGPNIEGMYFSEGHLLVYGFSSKNFVLYDTTAEEELMGVDTGGAHRSWTFQPFSKIYGGGTLVWTRASSMHICHQSGPNHRVVRSGGHGREIKAVVVSPVIGEGGSRQLIATGAEDTDIKIFEYERGDLVCRRTLRKHATGIQHLQWSGDGQYLFSSGGCEELFIWRVRSLPPELGSIGVVCEWACKPESEHADLRLMSFDIRRQESAYVIALVFSDSSIRVHLYDPTAAEKWQTVATGTYYTSCITQCVFLSSGTILTAGTDGHAVLWPLGDAQESSSAGLLKWEQPRRIHQSTSKTLATHKVDSQTTLIVSGGDDGSLSFLLASEHKSPEAPSSGKTSLHPPIIVTRAHASAVTACTVFIQRFRLFVVTSGNDQWVWLWEVLLHAPDAGLDAEESVKVDGPDALEIKRLKKMKTNVADVSSMAVLGGDQDGAARVLICGVGMEVIRIA